eukprot:gene19936-25899_t
MLLRSNKYNRNNRGRGRWMPLPLPVYEGRPKLVPRILDAITLNYYIPEKIEYFHSNSLNNNRNVDNEDNYNNKDHTISNPPIGLPVIRGCELTSQAAVEMSRRFPKTRRADIVRYLVARKGNIELASEMLSKSIQWHANKLPLKSSDEILRALSSKCFFPHGVDRDGAPVLYFRGALYDSKKASSDAYVMVASHGIDYALRNSNHSSVTVLVHAVAVPGAPNENTDTNFIKGFVQTLSDNFPERLKRLAIYPFPWYGRAIWSLVRVFVDKRTQEKVLLISHSGKGLPKEITDIVDPSEIPECCGGTDTRPIIDLETTLADRVISDVISSNDS